MRKNKLGQFKQDNSQSYFIGVATVLIIVCIFSSNFTQTSNLKVLEQHHQELKDEILVLKADIRSTQHLVTLLEPYLVSVDDNQNILHSDMGVLVENQNILNEKMFVLSGVCEK